jgi:probable rRNA maturation factor
VPKFEINIVGQPHALFLRDHLRKAHREIKAPLRELSVALVDEKEMSRLHESFMGIRGPTDVLTFEMEQAKKERVTAGEVVICVPYAAREATTRGIELKHELLLYALHGMLHLCGYDDRTPADYEIMHRREDEILTALGVGAVFRARKAKR